MVAVAWDFAATGRQKRLCYTVGYVVGPSCGWHIDEIQKAANGVVCFVRGGVCAADGAWARSYWLQDTVGCAIAQHQGVIIVSAKGAITLHNVENVIGIHVQTGHFTKWIWPKLPRLKIYNVADGNDCGFTLSIGFPHTLCDFCWHFRLVPLGDLSLHFQPSLDPPSLP